MYDRGLIGRHLANGPGKGKRKRPKQDAVRVDWKQKGKVLGSQRCSFSDFDGETDGWFYCTLEKPTLTAVGDIDAEIYYVDDRADSAKLIRTLKLTVNRYFVWSGMAGKKPIHDTYYQVDGSDLLGASWLWFDPSGIGVKFVTWMSRDKNDRMDNLTLRCSVDGKMLPDDLATWAKYQTDLVAGRSRHWTGKAAEDEKVRGWVRMIVSPELYHGKREAGFKDRPKMVYLTEHAGKWSCQLRDKGAIIREWKFVVDAKGDVVKHPEQAEWPLHRTERFIETRFSKPAWDQVFNPAPMKKTVMFGRPWAKPDALKDMLGALPPVKDMVAPRPPAGVK